MSVGWFFLSDSNKSSVFPDQKQPSGIYQLFVLPFRSRKSRNGGGGAAAALAKQ